MLFVAALAALMWANPIVEEGLTLVPGLGVVLFTRRHWIGSASTFVPIEQISGVIIIEVDCSLKTYSHDIGLLASRLLIIEACFLAFHKSAFGPQLIHTVAVLSSI